jgi:hypothetical protein
MFQTSFQRREFTAKAQRPQRIEAEDLPRRAQRTLSAEREEQNLFLKILCFLSLSALRALCVLRGEILILALE